MKKVLVFLVLLAGVGATGYLCAQSSETVSVWKDADYQQENAVEVQLVVEEETTTETTVEITTEAETETTTEAVQSTLPDYQDATGTYVVTVSCALADTAGGETSGFELAANLVVAVKAQEDVNGTTWDQVEYYGMTGWMPDANLTLLGDGQKMQESTIAWLFVEPGETVTVYAESCTAEELSALSEGGNTQAAEAGTFSYGTEVTVEEADGDWVKVVSGETSGWIPATCVAAYYPNTYYYADTNLNLRSGPSADNEKVGSLIQGATLIPQQIQGGWVMVESGGVTGWAALYYMTPCEDSDGGNAVAVTSTPTPTPTSAPAAQTTSSYTGTTSSYTGTTTGTGTTAGSSQTTVTEPSTATATASSGTGTATTESSSGTAAATTESTSGTTAAATDSSSGGGSGNTLEEIPESELGVNDVLEW